MMTEMPVDKALENVDYRGERFTTLEERSLAYEVKRLREELDQILGSIDGGGICEICRERANIRADRYRSALINIRTQIAAGTPTDLVWRLADNALRGEEKLHIPKEIRRWINRLRSRVGKHNGVIHRSYFDVPGLDKYIDKNKALRGEEK